MADKDEKDLSNFYEIKSLDQISIRIYFLYYRMLEAFKEEKISLYKFSFDTIIAVTGVFLGFIAIITFLEELDNIYKMSAIGAAIGAVIILLILKQLKLPKDEDFATISTEIELGMSLDQIFKQSTECLLLLKLSDKITDEDDLVKELIADAITVLKSSLDNTDELVTKLKKQNRLDNALKSISIDNAFLERRIKFGKSVLEKIEKISS